MNRGSVEEYADAIRTRYIKATKVEKAGMLNEFVEVTGYHRKSAIRLLNTSGKTSSANRRGRPRQYGVECLGVLKMVWEASDRLCSKRLQPFMAELIGAMERHGELELTDQVKAQVLAMSPSTMDRALRGHRDRSKPRSLSTTKPGSLLKGSIPIRTFTEWDDARPGFIEVDLVAHCGESTQGFYIHTLNAVDISTGWVETRAVWGKGHDRVGSAIAHVSEQLPFPLVGLDSDNGSEFINHHLFDYCQRNAITFTRSRPYKKNDSAHIEQKNYSVVRRLVGYDRYASREAFDVLGKELISEVVETGK